MSKHRRPRWHDRPRAWLRAVLDRICGREEEQPWDGEDDHGNHIGEDLPDYEYDDEPQVIRTAKVSGVHLPLSGEPNPWAPCAFRQDVPRPGREVTAGPRRDHLPAGSEDRAGPGYLTMWDIVHVRSPWPPRTWPAILSRPRIAAGRIALLAGAA